MGTNYYVATNCEHRGQHIGKRSAAGGGRMVFTWAVELVYMEGVAEIEDESGDRFTPAEFMALLAGCSIRDYHFIGTEFS